MNMVLASRLVLASPLAFSSPPCDRQQQVSPARKSGVPREIYNNIHDPLGLGGSTRAEEFDIVEVVNPTVQIHQAGPMHDYSKRFRCACAVASYP